MIPIDITFTDFDDKQVTETWHFHLEIHELIALGFGTEDSEFMKEYRHAVASGNLVKVMSLLDKVVMSAVGRKSDNNRRFVKDDDNRADFQQSGAYSALLMQLISGNPSAEKFFEGVMPKDMLAKVNEIQQNGGKGVVPSPSPNSGISPMKPIGEYTVPELVAMPAAEYAALSRSISGQPPTNFLMAGFQRSKK